MTRDELVEILSQYGQGVGSLTPGQVGWIMTMVDEYAGKVYGEGWKSGYVFDRKPTSQ